MPALLRSSGAVYVHVYNMIANYTVNQPSPLFVFCCGMSLVVIKFNPRQESLLALGLQVRLNDQQPELDSYVARAAAQQQHRHNSTAAATQQSSSSSGCGAAAVVAAEAAAEQAFFNS